MFVISYTVSKESGNPMSNTQHAGKKRNYIGFADHTKNGCMRETTTLNSSTELLMAGEGKILSYPLKMVMKQ